MFAKPRRAGAVATLVATALSAVSVGGLNSPATAFAPLRIDYAHCESGSGVNPYRDFFCFIDVSGGSGVYSFHWVGLTNAFLDSTDRYPQGLCYTGNTPGFSNGKTAGYRITVTDSAGAGITQDRTFLCAFQPI